MRRIVLGLERCQKPSGGCISGEKVCSISIRTVIFEGPKQIGVTGSSQRLPGGRHPKAHKGGKEMFTAVVR
jgi:hypothetical protein